MKIKTSVALTGGGALTKIDGRFQLTVFVGVSSRGSGSTERNRRICLYLGSRVGARGPEVSLFAGLAHYGPEV